MVEGVGRHHVVALARRKVPDKVHVAGNDYRSIRKSVKELVLWLRCSRWGHKAWEYDSHPRCWLYGKMHHHSSERGAETTAGEEVVPRTVGV